MSRWLWIGIGGAAAAGVTAMVVAKVRKPSTTAAAFVPVVTTPGPSGGQ